MKRFYYYVVILLTFLFPNLLISNEIIIGGLFDLSGPTSKVGKPYFLGVKDYINYHNSVNQGTKIKLVYYDTHYNANLAVREAKRLIKDGAKAIIGWGTGSSLRLKPIIQKYKIPFLPASFCQELIQPPDNSYIFLTAFSYADEINTIIQFIANSNKYRSLPVAIVTNPTKFGTEPIPIVLKYAKRKKVNIVFVYKLSLRPTERELELLKKEIKKFKPQIIIIHSTPGPFVKVSNLIPSIPNYSPVAIFGTFYTYTDDIIPQIPGSLIQKIFTIDHFALWYENTPGVNLMRFYSRNKYGKPIRNVYYIEGGVNAMLIIRGIEKIKGEITGYKLKKALESLHNLSTGGITPPISFSPRDHIAIEKLRILKVNSIKKRFTPVTGWISP